MGKAPSGRYIEANFDGIIGGTHAYRGLAKGNKASAKNKGRESHPKAAALQALDKAKAVADLTGAPQFVLPPHQRPYIPLLKSLGFQGSDLSVLTQAINEDPELLDTIYSASAMWTANAGTVIPSLDATDDKIHIIPASLADKLHRSLEGGTAADIFRAIFSEQIATVHDPLHLHPWLGDEGAANHTRFGASHGDPGVHLFVYGQNQFNKSAVRPQKYPARQTLRASQAVARLGKLSPEQVIFAQQNPALIDAGVFHNDVTAVGNENAWLLHAAAYLDTPSVIAQVREALGGNLTTMIATSAEVTPQDVVQSYLFNSQLLTLPNCKMAIVAPTESRDNQNTHRFLEGLVADPSNPVEQVKYMDVNESMGNGGGPACLRLRAVLSPSEIAAIEERSNVRLNDQLYTDLRQWINTHHRDKMTVNDLRDPSILNEQYTALDELTTLLRIGSVYDFQKTKVA